MKSPQNIKKSIKRLNIAASAETHNRVVADLLKLMEESKKTEPVPIQPNIWRKFMKSRITKLAAAAVIAIASFAAGHYSTEQRVGTAATPKSLFAKRLFEDIAHRNDYMVKIPNFETDFAFEPDFVMYNPPSRSHISLLAERADPEKFKKLQLLRLWEEGTSDAILDIYNARNIALVSDALFEIRWIEGYVVRAKFVGITSDCLKKEMLDIETGKKLEIEGYITSWEVVKVIDGEWFEDVKVIDDLFIHGDICTEWIGQLDSGTEAILAIRRIGYELYLIDGVDHAGDPNSLAILDRDEAKIREIAEIVRLGRDLIEAEIRIERKTESDEPLHRAIQHGDVNNVRNLIEEGADVNAKDGSGRIPLGYAAEKGNMEIVELLFAAGADVNGKGHDGQLPFVWASEMGHLDIAKLLILEGTDVTDMDNGGSTCLIWAAWKGRTELAEMLIDRGADVNSKDHNGGTALHDAVRGGHKEMVELLIAKGADVNAKSTKDSTPLDLAIGRADEEMAELLGKYGAIEGDSNDE
ncbi:MAG: ankyrin repeat domain-containing protein [Planctomycetota bacterium]|jgi:hypothetical protein